jgi:outer membrane protein TolC
MIHLPSPASLASSLILGTIIISLLASSPCSGQPGSPVALGHQQDGKGVLTLQEGLALVTERNRLIQIASWGKEISSDDVLLARSRYYPIVSASASETIQAYQPGIILSPSAQVRTQDKNYFAYGLSVYQTLYDFGARSSLYEASRASYEATAFDVERIRNLVALDFVTAYFDLLETERLITVIVNEIEGLRSHRDVAQALYEEGVITRNDLLQADVRLSDAQQRLLSARNTRAVNASRINTLLTRPLREEVRAADVPGLLPTVPDLVQAWQNAERQRPELKILDSEMKARGLEETARKSDYYPNLFAQGSYAYVENPFQIHKDNWALVAGLNITLSSGGSTNAEVSRLRHRQSQLAEQKRKTLDDVRFEVERSHLTMDSARERVRVTADAIGQARENLRITKTRYEEGVGTATDVLDAITLLTTAETNFYRAVYEVWRAHAALNYATGADLVNIYALHQDSRDE